MDIEDNAPKTLLEAVTYFADAKRAQDFVAALRWPDGAVCPDCAATNVLFLEKRKIWKCRACKRQFSVKVGTIFEDSPLPLSKWLPAMWMIVNCKNGISSYELSRALKVTQRTAWFMLQRIRLAMLSSSFKMSGDCEVDETIIGGRARNMHADKRERVIRGRGAMGKVAVMGILQRTEGDEHSTVQTCVVPNVKRRSLQEKVRETVTPGSAIFSDALRSSTTPRNTFAGTSTPMASRTSRAC